MNKLEYFEKEKSKSKQFISDISNSLVKIDVKIEELDKSKKKTDEIINKFEIQCYNYNLIDELIEARNNLAGNINSISKILKNPKINNEWNLEQYIKKIDKINELLEKFKVQLKSIDKEKLAETEKLQMNAIKNGIYNKYMLIKSDVDRDRIKRKFDKICNRNFLIRAYEKFFQLEETPNRRKEDLFFAIKEIDEAKKTFIKVQEPTQEYKINDILADIQIFLKENSKDKLYKDQISEIYKIKNNIFSVFSIDDKELKVAIKNKQKTKLPVVIDKKMNKTLKERRRIVAFLNKNGYVQTENIQIENNSYIKNVINKFNLISKTILNNEI